MNPLILIRHGHAEHLRGELTGGWTDTELNDAAHLHARGLTNEKLFYM